MGVNELLARFGDIYDMAGIKVKKTEKDRVPTKKMLLEDKASSIIFSHIDEESIIYVFLNGYVLFQTDKYSDMVRSTVFPLNKVGIKFEFTEQEQMNSQILEEIHQEIQGMKTVDVIKIYGFDKISSNLDNHVTVDYEDISSDELTNNLSSPDMAEQIAEDDATVQLLEALGNSISTLTSLQKQVIHLMYYHNYTQEECAKAMNITRSTVQSHERQALKNMGKYLKSKGYTSLELDTL